MGMALHINARFRVIAPPLPNKTGRPLEEAVACFILNSAADSNLQRSSLSRRRPDAQRRLTGAANPIAVLEQSNLVSGELHLIGRDQAVNCGADDSDVLKEFCHPVQGIIQSRLPGRNGP